MSGSCIIFVNGNSTNYKGYTRKLGDIFYPMMKSGDDFVIVEYDTIVTTVRTMNADLGKSKRIIEAGFKCYKRFLGNDCGLDVVELLAWCY